MVLEFLWGMMKGSIHITEQHYGKYVKDPAPYALNSELMMCELHLNKVERKKEVEGLTRKSSSTQCTHRDSAGLMGGKGGLRTSMCPEDSERPRVLGGARCSRFGFQKFYCAITGHARGKDKTEQTTQRAEDS